MAFDSRNCSAGRKISIFILFSESITNEAVEAKTIPLRSYWWPASQEISPNDFDNWMCFHNGNIHQFYPLQRTKICQRQEIFFLKKERSNWGNENIFAIRMEGKEDFLCCGRLVTLVHNKCIYYVCLMQARICLHQVIYPRITDCLRRNNSKVKGNAIQLSRVVLIYLKHSWPERIQ